MKGKASGSGMESSGGAHLDHCWLESFAPVVGRNVIEDELQSIEEARALGMQSVQRYVQQGGSHIEVLLMLRCVVCEAQTVHLSNAEREL